MRSLARVLLGPGLSASTTIDSIGTAEAPSALNCREHRIGPIEDLSDFAKLRDDPPSTDSDRSCGRLMAN